MEVTVRLRRRLGKTFRDEEGVTTIGMVVAMLVALALVFSSAQVYRVNSCAAEVQEVADVAALAAENEVAEFMVAARVCDAVVLSMTLLAATTCGLGVVALCVPAASGLSSQLLDLSAKILDARDAFAERASAGLSALQRALPFLAAANAASVASANNAASDARYFAAAVLVPSTCEDVSIGGAEEVGELRQAVDENAADIGQAAREAEEAARVAQAAKQRAFERDCGDSPAYCMYERASSLAHLGGESNPLYQSADAWSFSVALRRAQSYYAARLSSESPTSTSVSEQANSALRKRFYAYASDQLSRGYVRESDDSFEAYFPHLFKNVEQLRSTELYDEAIFPITVGSGTSSMHAWEGCPNAASPVEYGSVRDLEEGSYEMCALCEFTASSLGSVAAASSSIDNGFEYHYEAVAQAAEEYERARQELDPKTSQVKERAKALLDQCAQAVKGAGSKRIKVSPPGSQGVVAMVVNTAATPADAGFESSFVGGGRTLGARAAVSGATLLSDPAHDGASVLSSLLDGFGQSGGVAVGAARVVLDCWTGLLGAYTQGQEALLQGVGSALDSIPLASASGLGTWVSGELQGVLADVGLEPARVDALKPVLVNTGHVASSNDGSFAVSFLEAKERALSLSSSSTSLFTALVDDVEAEAFDRIERVEEGVVVAVVDFPVGELSVPITLAVPSSAADGARDFVGRCIDEVRSLAGQVSGIKVWS